MAMENPKNVRLQLLVLNTTSFFSQFSIAMINLAIVYYLRYKFQLSAQMIGLAASTYTFTYFLFCIVLGNLYAKCKPRFCVEMSLVGMAASIIMLLISTTVLHAFISLGIYGLFMSMLWPQIMSWLTRGKEKDELNTATSSFNFSWSFGAGLSPLFAGFLIERTTSLPLMVGISIFIIVFIFISVSTKFIPGIRAAKSEHQTNKDDPKVDLSTPLRFLCWAGLVTSYAAFSVILTIFPLFAQDQLHISESRVGILLLIRGFATCLMFVYLGRASWWQFKKSVVLIVQICVGIVCIIGIRATSMGSLAVFFLLFGILFAMVYTFSIFHGASGSVNRSRRMVIHEVLLTVGTILGASLGGTIYQHFDYALVLQFCSILVFIPVIFEIIRSWAFRRVIIIR
jgi:predicted MFS family arabinose efflux permease